MDRMFTDLQDCPVCGGPAMLEEENGWCFYVTCADCGCHTAEFEYRSEADREEAAALAIKMWGMGKVLSHNPGE